jgi:Ca2+/Na+ antiporter
VRVDPVNTLCGKGTRDEGTMILELLYGLLYIASLLISIGSVMFLRRFLHQTSAIADQGSLEKFKAVARAEMYATLLLMVILILGAAVGGILTILRGLPMLVVVIVTNFSLWAFSRYHKRVEDKTRSLAVTESLAQEYRHVCESWVKKALPDF